MGTYFILSVLALILPTLQAAEMDQICAINICQEHISKLEREIKVASEVMTEKCIQQITDKIDNQTSELRVVMETLDRKNRNMQNNLFESIRNSTTHLKHELLEGVTMIQNQTTEIAEIKAILKSRARRQSDCLDLLNNGNTKSGVYTIHPAGYKEVTVYCDMVNNEGGCTVFLLRQKQAKQEDFNANWKEFKEGFGRPPGEYWLGNEALHQMTSSKKYSLIVEKHRIGSSTIESAEWTEFKIESEKNKYRLRLSGHSSEGPLAKEMNYLNGQYFTTKDNDNDSWLGSLNCADHFKGAFWYKDCTVGTNFPTLPFEKYSAHTKFVMKIR